MIKTAIILAAGVGSRLQPLTNTMPKCLVPVHDKPLLAHQIDALEKNGIEQVYLITGYKSEDIDLFLETYNTTLKVTTILNPYYDSTNNIYSLWLAGKKITSGAILLESDLIFDPAAIKPFIKQDKAALELYDPTVHHGTTVDITEEGFISDMHLLRENGNSVGNYKTVNIYSFSSYNWRQLISKIDTYIENQNLNVFYESAIGDLIRSGDLKLQMVDFNNFWWDEIDTPEDLERVNGQLVPQQSGLAI